MIEKPLRPAAYQSLAELRYQIGRFLYFSEQAARNAGLEPQWHQFMLALKGLPKGVRPRIAELAERMQIQHHSAVELTNRLAANGYIRRSRKGQDRREVLLALTAKVATIVRHLRRPARLSATLGSPSLHTSGWYWFLFWRQASA